MTSPTAEKLVIRVRPRLHRLRKTRDSCQGMTSVMPIGLPPPLSFRAGFSPRGICFSEFLRSLRASCPVNSPHIFEAVMEAVILSGLQAAKDPYSWLVIHGPSASLSMTAPHLCHEVAGHSPNRLRKNSGFWVAQGLWPCDKFSQMSEGFSPWGTYIEFFPLSLSRAARN